MTTSLLLHFDGANDSTTFIDETGKTVTSNGGAKLSTAWSAFGPSSGVFDGVNDYLQIADGADFQFGSGDFQIDLRARFSALPALNVPAVLISRDKSAVASWQLFLYNSGGAVGLYLSASIDGVNRVYAGGAWTPALYTPYALRAIRTGNTLKVFVGGVQLGASGTLIGSIHVGTNVVRIGCSGDAYGFLSGYIDELRVLKGSVEAVGDYTPQPYPFGTPAGASSIPVSITSAPTGQASLPVVVQSATPGAASLPVVISSMVMGVSALPIIHTALPSGPAVLPVVATALPTGAASLPVSLRSAPASPSALAIRARIIPPGIMDGSAPGSIGTPDPSPPAGYAPQRAAVWRPVATLDGADITAQVVGEIEVVSEEGAARIATFSLKRAPGEAISLAAWTGKPVTIDYAIWADDGSALYPMRRFTGKVDTPAFDPATRMIRLTCTDDLQGVANAMTDDQIDAWAQGRWSGVVFDSAKSHGWQRLQDRASTQCASLDLDPNGYPRRTPWQAAATAHLECGPGVVEDDSVAVTLAGRAGLVNKVEIAFAYRYPRLKAVGYPVSHTVVSELEFADFVTAGNWFLTREAVRQALDSAGATVIGDIDYVPLPTSPVGTWYPGPYDAQMCRGFACGVSFDYGQTITEAHAITVSAPLAVAQVGEKIARVSSALEAAYQDVETWEERTWAEKTGINIALQPAEKLVPIEGKTVQKNAEPTPETSRSAANGAMECLIDMAKRQIQDSSRRNEVGFTVPLNPAIDLDKTLRVVAETVTAKGKVRRTRDLMNPETGRAVTEITLAICAIAGTGIDHPDTATTAPAGDDPGDVAHDIQPLVQFNAGPAEDHALTIEFPGIEEADRANSTVALASQYDAGLIEDEITITT